MVIEKSLEIVTSGVTQIEQPEIQTLPEVNQEERIVVSVVSPFYNEEQILETAVTIMLRKMAELDIPWELIVVNDGSRDNSEAVVAELCEENPQLKLLSYPVNRGRGYALRTGIAEAKGDIIITTEIDLSWGEDIVELLYNGNENAAQNRHSGCQPAYGRGAATKMSLVSGCFLANLVI